MDSEKCGQNLKNVGRRAVVLCSVNSGNILSLQQLFCPHFSDSAHIFQKVTPSLKKRPILGLKNFGMVPKKNLWPPHMYKWYIFKKKLAKIGQFYPQHWRKESSGAYMGLPPPTR